MKKQDSISANESLKIYLIAAILFLTVMAISYLTWFGNS
jgi:hypothetical protein